MHICPEEVLVVVGAAASIKLFWIKTKLWFRSKFGVA